MSKIVFRGKTYNSVFEMPDDIRKAYQTEKRNRPTDNKVAKPLTDFVEMSDEIRELYERALGNLDDRTVSSRPLSDLPNTDDIYRQSAPAHMKDLPSDESAYRQSEPVSPPSKPAIELDNGPLRLAWTLVALILLGGIIFLVMQYVS